LICDARLNDDASVPSVTGGCADAYKHVTTQDFTSVL
jgi:hypothetical protein